MLGGSLSIAKVPEPLIGAEGTSIEEIDRIAGGSEGETCIENTMSALQHLNGLIDNGVKDSVHNTGGPAHNQAVNLGSVIDAEMLGKGRHDTIAFAAANFADLTPPLSVNFNTSADAIGVGYYALYPDFQKISACLLIEKEFIRKGSGGVVTGAESGINIHIAVVVEITYGGAVNSGSSGGEWSIGCRRKSSVAIVAKEPVGAGNSGVEEVHKAVIIKVFKLSLETRACGIQGG